MKSRQGAEIGVKFAFCGMPRCVLAGGGVAFALAGAALFSVFAMSTPVSAAVSGSGPPVSRRMASIAEPFRPPIAPDIPLLPWRRPAGEKSRSGSSPFRAAEVEPGTAIVPPVKREAPGVPEVPAQQAGQTQPKKPEVPAPAKPKDMQPTLDVFTRIQDWLARANREYQGVIMKKLSQPAGTPTPLPGADKKIQDAKSQSDGKKAEEDARNLAEAKRLEEDRKKTEDARHLAEEGRKRAEDAIRAEEAKKAEAQQKAEAQRKAEEAKKAEAPKAAEPAPAKPDEGKAAEDARKSEEAKRIEALRVREAQQLKDAERAAEERKRQEAARIEDQKKQEAAARLEDQKRQEALRLEAEKRKTAEAEAARHSSRQIIITPEPIPRPQAVPKAPGLTTPAPVAAPEVRPAPAAAKAVAKPKDTRIAEGSAETGPVEAGDGTDAGSTGSGENRVRTWDWRPRTIRHTTRCRAAGRLVTPPAHYVVRRGDSLWRISARHYHKGRLYRLIWRANRRSIANPDLIFPCQRVFVPRRR